MIGGASLSAASQVTSSLVGSQGAPAVSPGFAPTPRLIVGSPEATSAIVDAIDGAQHVVDVELFSLKSDGSGKELADSMKRAVKRGVQVNLISDITGSMMIFPSQIKMMYDLEQAGVNLKMSTRISPIKAKRYVDHRKSIVVDGNKAFVGGMNFGKQYDKWHDAMVYVQGIDAAQVGVSQLQRWSEMGGRLTPLHVQTVQGALDAARAAGQIANIAPQVNAPARKDFELTEYYYDKIANAKTRILFASPGLSDPKTLDLLVAAAKRGVDVTFVTSGPPPLGLPIITWGTRSASKRLVEAGVKVYETPDIAHTKAMLVDDEITSGSYNITKRSSRHDDELNLVSKRPEVVRQFEQLFQRDIARSKRLTGTEKRSMIQKVFDVAVIKLHIGY